VPCERLRQKKDGFTLLEVMVTVMILAIVLTTILASFRTLFSNQDALAVRLEGYRTAETCLNRIVTDLKALYVRQPPQYRPPEFNDPPDPYRFVGSSQPVGGDLEVRLSFTALAHLPSSRAAESETALARITYYIEPGSDSVGILRRADRPFPFDGEPEPEIDPVMAPRVVELKVAFVDGEGETHDEWDSDTDDVAFATPVAVNVAIVVADGGGTTRLETVVTLPVVREPLPEGS